MKTKWMTLGVLAMCGGVACIDHNDTEKGLQPQVEEAQAVQQGPTKSVTAETPPIKERVRSLEQQIDDLKDRIATDEGLRSKFGSNVDALAAQIADARVKVESTMDTEGAVDSKMKNQLDEAVAEIEQKLDELESQIGA